MPFSNLSEIAMTPNYPWPPPFPFPPPASRSWTPQEYLYLIELLQWRLQEKILPERIAQIDIVALAKKLATVKAVKRFRRAQVYTLKKENRELRFIDWLDRVIQGYLAYIDVFHQVIITDEGETLALKNTSQGIVSSAYNKVHQRRPTPEQREEIIARLFLVLIEDYFYDVGLNAWLSTTARNIIISEARQNAPIVDETELNIEIAVTTGYSSDDLIDAHILHEALLEAIEKINNRRYRVVLLLIYIYQLNNQELAAFFGVTVPRATTWLSRARRALRGHYDKPPIAL